MYQYLPPNRNGFHHKGQLIKVTGEGELAIQPDSASVNLGVITEYKELIAAQQQNSNEVSKVINALLGLGIPQNQLQTFDYRIESDYDYDQGKQTFRGYKITHLLQVNIEDLSIIGKVVDTAVKNGVNYVSNVQFKAKNKDAFYQQALSLALTNAIEKAKTIAGTLNVTLVPTPSLVVEGGGTVQPFNHQSETFVKSVSSTQFEPGQIIVKATISAEFHYQTPYKAPL
ncbi:SIMPL domain-containing protein [Neobacillus sp. OS1-2]|uniref:SIMPL domain-containing protein n=1 Tax=Neobacillus sp. OS1-2 TaxID=3070680 RepID=UPI0027E00A1C|nr:SIMPL domain-containing protein [Neobacillus sp. OS1-2]WML40508.1 SIMPL domain-containing protein [Neobacillus sp. OS1-2]